MRLICTISSESADENPYEFSYFLSTQKISNECEEVTPSDGSVPYHRIWIYDEDHVDQACQLYQEYHHNPKDSRFRIHDEETIRVQEQKVLEEEPEQANTATSLRRSRVFSPAPYGKISLLILFIVVVLFVFALAQKGIHMAPKLEGVAEAPLVPPIEKALIYDYPSYFELRDALLALYTSKDIEEKQPLSEEALVLVRQMKRTPYWTGLYDRVVKHLQDPSFPISYQGPIFEKIGQGQVWRLFTPALLHFDLLHIFFNVLWFILLGNQIEYRIGSFRYLLLILVTALISNTSQYLMSGSFFMGLSGIVCGMAAFIWARQQTAPWEGYLLHRLTLLFLAIFVFGMFALQFVFFFLETFSSFKMNVLIANTAHIAGGISGYLLGRLRFFALQHVKNKI